MMEESKAETFKARLNDIIELMKSLTEDIRVAEKSQVTKLTVVISNIGGLMIPMMDLQVQPPTKAEPRETVQEDNTTLDEALTVLYSKQGWKFHVKERSNNGKTKED